MKKNFTLFKLIKSLPFFLATLFVLRPAMSFGQNYLGLNGGFEGTATISNTVSSSAQPGAWAISNANQSLTDETTIVRSGNHSLKATNSTTTGRRIWSPLITTNPTTSNVTIQFYRYTGTTDTQMSRPGIGDGTSNDTSPNTYTAPSTINVWEKVIYTKSAWSFTDIASVIWNKAINASTPGCVYIDDVSLYAGTEDNTPPDPAQYPSISPAPSSLTVRWTAPASGTDNGGYLVVRGTSDPVTPPNLNGIYATSNEIAPGATVVYQGIDTSFADEGLAPGTTYYYRIYTYDKAYNYSTAVNINATTSLSTSIRNPSTDTKLQSIRYFTIGGIEVEIPVKGYYIEKSFYSDGTIVTRKIVK